jgi:hypothetical protein
MNADKDRIGGVDVLDVEDNFLGLFALLKADAAAATTVQFNTNSEAIRVTEGATATLTVELTSASTSAVTVQYRVSGGSATGSDYTISGTGTLSFPPGQTSRSFNVVTRADSVIEGDETVTLELFSPTGATLGPRSTATVTITDDDATSVQFQQPVVTVKENVATAVITAVRTGASATAFSVTYTATPITAVRDVDFKLPASNTLTFAAGVLTRAISVTIVNNTLVDGNRSFMLILGQPTNGAQLGPQSATTVIIQDDDQAGQFKVDKPTYTVAENAGSLSIIVRRLGTSLAGNVTVGYFTQDGTATSDATPQDYVSTSGTLTFKAGETMKTVAIPVITDRVVDGPKTFTFRLRNPSAPAELVEGQSSAVVTITDVDLPGVIKFVPDKYSVSENAGKVTLTVKRTGGLGGGVLVDFITQDGSAVGGVGDTGGDFRHTSGTLTFGFGNTSASVTVFINQDTLAEGNETFTVKLSNARTPAGRELTTVLPSVGQIATVTIVDDESAFQFSAPTFHVKEGTPNAVVTVLRTGTRTTPASVTYSASPGTAQPGIDFTPVPPTILAFPPNVPSKTFNVPIINNTRLDGNRSVLLTLSSPTGGAELGTPSTATLIIEDNEQAGTFKLDKGAYTVLESAGFVSVNVLRSGLNLTGNVSVNLIATDDTAKNGINYTAPAAAVVFAAGETTKTVKIPILRDSVVTGPPQKFTLALSEASSGAKVGTPGSATVSITEADVAGQVRFSPATYFVNESAGTVTLTVQRTGGTAGGVLVDFTTVNGAAIGGIDGAGDFGNKSGTLTFNAGNTSATISIAINQDDLSEGNEAFTVQLSNPRGGATLGSPATATVTIMDDDSSIVQFSGNFIGNYPEVVRIGTITNEAFVDFDSIDGTAQGGSDYTPTRGTLTFKANTRTTTIPLVIANDIFAEGFETFTYLLRNPRGTRLGPESQKTFTITDNDFGGDNIQFTAPSYPGTEGQSVTLTITRTGGFGSELVVQWSAGPAPEGTRSATPGEDFSPASGSVTFAPNAQSATFTINLLSDNFVEGPEAAVITLSVPEAAATLGPQSSTTLQIQDVAPPASVVQFTASTSSAAHGQDKEITLVRSGALGPLAVNVTATGGTAVAGEDFSLGGEVPNSTVVNFGAAATTASFTVHIPEAGGGEPDRTAIFGLSIASGTATIGPVGTTTLTILGSTSELNLDLSVYSVTEGGGPAIITVSRRGNLNRQVSASFATSNGTAIAGTHYTTGTGTITFPIGETTATFTVPILNNGPGDGTRTVNLTLSNPSPNTTLGEGDTARLEIREGPVFTFQRIAETDEQIVGFEGTPAINDSGRVAFKALVTDAQQQQQQQILTGSGGPLTTVAATGEQFAEFGTRTPIDSDGQVAFLALLANEQSAIFRGDDESLSQVAITSAQLSQLFEPAMSRNGRLAFAGQTPQGPLRLFSGPPGGPFPLVPGTDGLFFNLGIHPAVNDDGVVAFVATSEPGRGIYSVAPGDVIGTLADDVDVATFTNVSFNDAGRAAFIPGSGNIRGSVLLSAGGGNVVPFATAADGFQNFGEVNDEDNSPVINDPESARRRPRDLHRHGDQQRTGGGH